MTSASDKQLLQLLELPEEQQSLALGALILSLDEYPQLNIADYQRRLREWGRIIRCQLHEDARDSEKLSALNYFLFHEMGLHGNEEDYYDPRNCYIHEAIEYRVGLPITLAIIYLELGQQLGLPLYGANFPGHFLVTYRGTEGTYWLDPYNGGMLLTRRDLEARLRNNYGKLYEQMPSLDEIAGPASNRAIWLRVLRNLKGIYLQKEDFVRAVAVLGKILLLEPESAPEYRDRARLYEKLDCPQGAMHDWRQYLILTPTADSQDEARVRLRELQAKVHQLH